MTLPAFLTFTAILLILAAIAYLRRVVKQAAVEPVIDGKFPVKVFSEKRLYEVLWEEWKFWVGLVIGLSVSLVI